MRQTLLRSACLALALVVLVTAGVWAQAPQDGSDQALALSLVRTLQETQQQWLDVVKQNPNDPDEQAFAQWLQGRPDVANAQVQDDSVVVVTADGLTLVFSNFVPGILGSGIPYAAAGGASLKTVSPSRPIRYAFLPPTLFPTAVPGKMRCLGDIVPKGNALIIDTLAATGNYYSVIPALRKTLEYVDYTVNVKPGKVNDFLDMATASIIVVKGHGGVKTIAGQKHYVVTADYFETTTNPGQWIPYVQWLKQGELLAVCSVKYDANHNPTKAVVCVGVVDTWFDKHIESMVNNSALVFITCHSADIDRPWQIFKAKGASSYFGFKGSVQDSWACDWATRLLDRSTGANQFQPWDTNPPRRAQSFRQAYDYIYDRPNQKVSPTYNGTPKLFSYWEPGRWAEGGDSVSCFPHIDFATLSPIRDSDNYELVLYGAFGHESECGVYLNDTPVPFHSIAGGGGGVFSVTLPKDGQGTLVVVDGDDRISNPITISRFNTTVKFNYDDPFCAGKVTLQYEELVLGWRRYRDIKSDLIFEAHPEDVMDTIPYVLASMAGDWRLQWDFDSFRQFGEATLHALGHGTASGRGAAEGDEEPEGGVSVMLEPTYGPANQTSVQAEVMAAASAGPIRFIYITPTGTSEEKKMISALGYPAAQVDYDPVQGVLAPVPPTAGMLGTWEMESVTLSPRPSDMTKAAWLPKRPITPLAYQPLNAGGMSHTSLHLARRPPSH